MSLVVLKFGGTSVKDIERIKKSAEIVKKEVQEGHQVVVIVSAMAGVTNRLVEYCADLSELKTPEDYREYDAALSSGENVTAALMAMALKNLNICAKSVQGWQIPIMTDNNYGKAHIKHIGASAIEQSIVQGIVPVIAGFQGISEEGNIATLGRGGSDITATAISAFIKAERCDIYTDVAGVYSADPNLIPESFKIEALNTEIMLELAKYGAKVLNFESVRIALNNNIKLRVLSSYEPGSGTIIDLDTQHVRGVISIAVNYNQISLLINTNNYSANEIADILAQHNIEVDIFYVSQSLKQIILTTFITEAYHASKVLSALFVHSGDYAQLQKHLNMISLVGHNIDINAILEYIQLLSRQFETEIYYYQTNNNRFSFLVESSLTDDMVKALHQRFISV